jgi:acyl transferase domain-containing protein/acyl carrier protein
MAGRFPGARTIDVFRQNLLEGVESITFFDEKELRAAEVPEEDLAHPDFVGAAPVLGDTDLFDAALFGLSAREAQLLDPQFRVFLEVCHAALQQAGVVPGDEAVRIGVYAGSKHNAYLDESVARNSAIMRATGLLMAVINNHTDYLATNVAFRLGLTGPAVTMVTACSTSLVAVHTAVQALRAGECDIAIAGGVEIDVPEVGGYIFAEGGIFSPDGHVRPFDAKARGTVFGSGCGAVVLKRLDDAIADASPIQVVVRGSAINNDGNAKSGFFAPSRTGQVAVINAALADADVDAATIGYVEAHGTGTLVGDPIEVGALSDAFSQHTDQVGYCAIASVKANVGHLGAAAGVTGLINAACSVRDGLLAPTINFDEPNPSIEFGRNPFYVNTAPTTWAADQPRRAAVSSFGIGGTNASIIVEQAPDRQPLPEPRRAWQLLPLSAHTPDALDQLSGDLAAHLSAHQDPIADVSFTLSTGRQQLKERRFVVARDIAEAADRLGLAAACQAAPGRTATFLFPGQGSQYPGMAAGLYEQEPVFRSEIDSCAEVLRQSHGLDLLGVLTSADAAALRQTCHAQPALFAVEYALARALMAAGIVPTALAGHSVGEYVAATIAGVLARDDALRLVAERGRLMQSMDTGAMLAVTLPEDMLAGFVGDVLDIAAVNAPGMCVVSGPAEDIIRLEDDLAIQGIAARRLHTSHAFHSRMMEPMLERFGESVRSVPLHVPSIPFVSNITGTWIADDEATDPAYWVRHVRSCVRFSDTLRLLTSDGIRALAEVGPGRALTGMVQAHDRAAVAVPTMRHPQQPQSDMEALLGAVGQMWAEGVELDWTQWWAGEHRYLLPLPEYPYQRQRYWIEPDGAVAEPAAMPAVTGPYTVPVWLESVPPAAPAASGVWVMLAEPGHPVLTRLGELAQQAGIKLVVADSEETAVAAAAELSPGGDEKLTVVHARTVGARPAGTDEAGYADQWLERGFHSVLRVLQDIARRLPSQAVNLVVVSSAMQDVYGDGLIEPAKAAVLGVVKVAPKEIERLTCRSIDIGADSQPDQAASQLLAEIASGTDPEVAYRGRKRWTWSFAGMPVQAPDGPPASLRDRGVYVLTGGLGGLGLVLARQLGQTVSARLALLSRGMPPREQWPAVLANEPGSLVAARIRGVQAAEAAGAEVMVLCADVTDEAELRAAKDEIETRFGQVDGVFHLAAVAGGAMLETRAHDDAAAVFAPKVTGTYLLEKVFDPDLMVLYSSISVFSADFGQGDYVGANAVLDAFAQSRHAHGRRVIAVNWAPFDDVGMTAVNVAPSVIGNLLFGRSSADAAGSNKTTEPETDLRPTDHPMLRGQGSAADGEARFAVDLSSANWVLAEHRLAGAPMMPGTGIVELIRAAHAELTGEPSGTVADLVFQHPLREVPGMRAWLGLRRREDDWYDIALTSDNEVYASGRVGASARGEPRTEDLEALRSACVEVGFQMEKDMQAPELGTTFGPRWQGCIRRRWSGPEMEIVSIKLPEQFHADLADFGLHPAALDCAVSFGQIITGDGSYLPFSYDEVTGHGALPAEFVSIIRHLDDTSGDVTSADITIVDPGGREIVRIRRYTRIRIDNAFTGDPSPAADAVTKPEEQTDGLVTAEQGEEALRQILGAHVGPQVIWCPEGLGKRMRRSARLNRSAIAEEVTAQTGGTEVPRTLTTPYVDPEGELELALAELWSDSLGVERVGAEDDFFDLGGNSLFAVQLVSRIGHRFSIDASAALLFDSRNVRTLAAAIEKILLEKVTALSEDEAAQAIRGMEAGGDVVAS